MMKRLLRVLNHFSFWKGIIYVLLAVFSVYKIIPLYSSNEPLFLIIFAYVLMIPTSILIFLLGLDSIKTAFTESRNDV